MKIKFGIKSIFRYLYIISILLNFLFIYMIYGFIKENIYASINPGEEINYLQNKKRSEDLNMQKFNEAIEKIKQKNNNNVVFTEKENSLKDLDDSNDNF